MDRTAPTNASSQIKSVGYDAKNATLEIEFPTGKVYQYFNVSEKEYNELMKAESPGKYFNANIKSHRFLQIPNGPAN